MRRYLILILALCLLAICGGLALMRVCTSLQLILPLPLFFTLLAKIMLSFFSLNTFVPIKWA